MGQERAFPPGYLRCCEQMAQAIPEWIANKCKARYPDLQWHEWGTTVFAGGLDSGKYLAASPDAMELLAYLDELTGKQGTLLQAKVVLESLGVKAPEHTPPVTTKPGVKTDLLVEPGINPNRQRKGKSGETARRRGR